MSITVTLWKTIRVPQNSFSSVWKTIICLTKKLLTYWQVSQSFWYISLLFCFLFILNINKKYQPTWILELHLFVSYYRIWLYMYFNTIYVCVYVYISYVHYMIYICSYMKYYVYSIYMCVYSIYIFVCWSHRCNC